MRYILIILMALLLSGATYNDIDVTTTATKIVEVNGFRDSVVIQNLGTDSIYIGHDNSVTTTDSIELEANERYTDSGEYVWRGAIWGIASSGTQDIRYWERP